MEFLDAYEILDPAVKEQCAGTRTRLLDALRMHSFFEFRYAESFVAEMRERVYAHNVKDALTGGRASIDREPHYLEVNESADYRVALDNFRYDGAAARDCFTCRWDFGDDCQPEKGWKVSHYFFKTGNYDVSVTFTDDEGEPLVSGDPPKPVTLTETIKVESSEIRPWGERSKIEAMQLAIVLLVACFTLLAGANDQLAKVDLVPGLIAVFVLGFSADQIKTALFGKK